MAKVLVVDDEKLIVKGIRFSLEQDGMEVDCAYDGEEAIRMAKETEYDIVLLDVMLPKFDGFEVCQAIREFSEMPIIMVTAKDSELDKVLGLELGADDYVCKPFNRRELLARVKNLLRRTAAMRQLTRRVVRFAGFSFDTAARHVTDAEGRAIQLTRGEFELFDPQRAALRIGRRNRAGVQDGGANLHRWAPVSVSAAIPTGEGAAVKA